MQNFSMNSFVAGLMLGSLLTGAWFFNDTLVSILPQPPVLPAAKTELPMQESSTISVANQVAGSEVIVESVTVPPPGVWVAVREVHGTSFGNVLGALRVGGPISNIRVPLLRSTEPGNMYAIELYRDDGTAIFDQSVLSAYVDFDSGLRAIAYFKTLD